MPNLSTFQQWLYRDGASQAERELAALAPEYVAVDERSLKDLLAFAREYAKELVYYNADNQAMGDWSAFLSPDLDLDEVIAFMRDPASVSPARAFGYSRPHVVLFLTFLELLRQAQDHLNTLTRRHLDFYYREVLRMTNRPGAPDQVTILVDLDEGTEHARLPAGTRLNAGTDSLGRELLYCTDQDLEVTHAQVARLSSVYADKRLTGIREARELHDGPKDEGFMHMLRIALGHPAPGDPLPPYATGEGVDYAYLGALYQLVNVVPTHLYMGFAAFRSLMQLKRQRDQADEEWNEINQLLEKAGRQRRQEADFQLQPTDPRDFDANLAVALGGPPNFDGITEVEDIDDLYDQRTRQDVQQAIRERLYFDDVEDFFRMMRIKVRIDNEWREMNRLLEQAGQQKRHEPTYSLPITSPSAFEANLDAALGPLDFASLSGLRGVDNIDTYDAELLRVEQYFFMLAENFAYVLSVAEAPEAHPQAWHRVYQLLADAHGEKVYAARRARLQEVRESQGFEAMLRFALGETSTAEQTALEQLEAYIRNPNDTALLRQISRADSTGAVTPTEWLNVYRIVELAQRMREHLSEPVAQKEAWLNLYAAEDAMTVAVAFGVEADADNPRWRTFGEGQPSVSRDAPAPRSFGWAISSPLLALHEGQRTITLTLAFQADTFHMEAISDVLSAVKEGPFELRISTEKGWIEPDAHEVRVGDYQTLTGLMDAERETLPALQFVLTCAENVDALAPSPVEDAPINSNWPLLRLLLRQCWQPGHGAEATGRYVTYYQPFKALQLLRTHLAVEVTGLRPSHMQNDTHSLDVKKPFEPFGTRPAIGSRFYFSHPEIIYQPLDRLNFHLEWMGVPSDLPGHYANYDDLAITPADNFTACISLIDKRLDLPLAPRAPLFADPDATVARRIDVPDVQAAIQTGRPGYRYARRSELADDADLLAWSRYVQWELNEPDFQHAAYPAVTAKKSIAMAAAIANQQEVRAEQYQVNSPYTPKLKSLHLSYRASTEIRMAAYTPGSEMDRIFHIHPFGACEILPDVDLGPGNYAFLPQFNHEGELYIGIRDVRPPQSLSLLFQMAEGSADPDLEPVPIAWSYLSGNRWMSLENGNIKLDTTRGLINSGIITFSLVGARPNTLLPAGLYWLRAAISQRSTSVCAAVAIHAQAVSATFANQDNAPDHLSRPLAAESISKLAAPLPEISGIRQPYTSYGGKMAERDQTFYTRLSERLRHKQRALNLWDYEHLILEKFPQIYKVKCLPAGMTGPSGRAAHELGSVVIVVIPNIRNKIPFNPFEPKAPADLIADIESYLAQHTPAWATVNVRNAHFVQVKVRFAVRFRTSYNEGYYKQILNDELNRFLSPWAYAEEGERAIEIGGKMYANLIINFLEERPYVDYVAEVKLFSSDDGRTFKMAIPSASEGYWVETERPDAVLVAARQHVIDMITEAGYEEESYTGINYMRVDLDFRVE
jgi:hypothetical protein